MVEHLLCKQGVIGSNPIVSTRASAAMRGVWLLAFHGMVPTSAWLACPRERGVAVGPCGCAGCPEGCRARPCVLLLL